MLRTDAVLLNHSLRPLSLLQRPIYEWFVLGWVLGGCTWGGRSLSWDRSALAAFTWHGATVGFCLVCSGFGICAILFDVVQSLSLWWKPCHTAVPLLA